MVTFEILDNDLAIEDKFQGQVLWQGRPLGCSVKKIRPIDDQTSCIALLDYYEFSKSRYRDLGNLLLVEVDGKIKWNAELPETSDTYVDFSYNNGLLFASTWAGFRVQIDLHNGFILNKKFTK